MEDDKVEKLRNKLDEIDLDFKSERERVRALQEMQLVHIRNQEERQRAAAETQARVDAIFFADNAPEAKREWQRHQVAITVLGALIWTTGRTQDDYPARAYDMAELMLQERERRQQANKPDVSPPALHVEDSSHE